MHLSVASCSTVGGPDPSVSVPLAPGAGKALLIFISMMKNEQRWKERAERRRDSEETGKKTEKENGAEEKGERMKKRERELERWRDGERGGHSWTWLALLHLLGELLVPSAEDLGRPAFGDTQGARAGVPSGCTWRRCC